MARGLMLGCFAVLAGCAGSPIEAGNAGSIGAGEDTAGRTTDGGDSSDGGATKGSMSGGGSTDAGDASDPTGAGDPTNPSDPSDPSDPSGSSDPTVVSDGTQGSGDTSGATDPTAVGSSGMAEGDGGVCVEDDESNQDYAHSVPLGMLACNGGSAQHSAVVDAATSPDWFYFKGQWFDACGEGEAEPTVTFTEGADLPFCLQPSCDSGGGTAICVMGDPVGNRCCGTGVVSMTLDCNGGFYEDADIDIIVDAPDAACVPFTFEYSY